MSHLTNGQLVFAATVLIATELLVIWLIGLRLAVNRPADIRITCYFLSLASLASLAGAVWAHAAGWIDGGGSFQGRSGAAINSFLKFMLDVSFDVYVLITILVLIVLPQCLSYVLAGIFGCASSPIFVGKALSFFVWGIVKSFVVAAGVLLAIALYGYANSWRGWTLRGAVSMLTFSMTILCEAFAILSIYRGVVGDIMSLVPPPDRTASTRPTVGGVRAWLTRNVR